MGCQCLSKMRRVSRLRGEQPSRRVRTKQRLRSTRKGSLVQYIRALT